MKHGPGKFSVSTRAIAVIACASLVAPYSAQAQFFSSSGANDSAPANLFPINPSAPSLNFSGESIAIGDSATGSFSAMAGALLTADAFTVGNNSAGNGTAVVTGTGTSVQLGGAGVLNRLQVGNWGTGTLTVSAGASLDATVNAASCTSASTGCYSFVGNGAGSTGTLNVTGAGSQVNLMRVFTVGNDSVFTLAHDGFNFGTPGGTTSAFVNVLNGGTLRTQTVIAGQGPTAGAALGTETAMAQISISGPGSQWIATRNTADNTAAYFAVGNGVGGNATVGITGGGALIVDGTGGSTSSFDELAIGVNGAIGSVTVSGTGSSLQVKGNNPYIGVGTGTAGQGSLTVQAGATASSLLAVVGRSGANGTLVVNGIGSQLNLVGVGTPGVQGAGGLNIGQNGGSGQVTVSNGGSILIGDGGGDSRTTFGTSNGNPFLNVGWQAGATGSLTITGAGSTVQMISTSLGLAAGVPDNYNPYMAVGRNSGDSGSLTVSNGGTLLLQGNAVSTVANTRQTELIIGGTSNTTAGGTGSALVTGAGSTVSVIGSDSFIGVGVGPGSVGQLTISNQGTVDTRGIAIGRSGGTGTLTMNNGILNLSGQETGDLLVGAVLNIGTGGAAANGTALISNGSQINVTNLGSEGASVNIGGSSAFPLGSGTLNVSGASSINVSAASGLASFTVGRDGTGSAIFSGGSSINLGDGSAYIGRLAGSTGTLELDSGSSMTAGYVGIGATPSGTGGAGHLILNNSTITTTTLDIGAGSVLSGDGGVIKASGNVNVAGTISPGNSPGRITIECNFITLAGSKLVLDILDTGSGFNVDHLILGNDSTFDLSKLQVVFNFLGNTDPNAFLASGGFELDNFFESLDLQTNAITGLSSVFAPGQTWSDILNPDQISAVSDDYTISNIAFSANGGASFTAAAIPEPDTWLLLLAGLGVLLWVRKRPFARARVG